MLIIALGLMWVGGFAFIALIAAVGIDLHRAISIWLGYFPILIIGLMLVGFVAARWNKKPRVMVWHGLNLKYANKKRR